MCNVTNDDVDLLPRGLHVSLNFAIIRIGKHVLAGIIVGNEIFCACATSSEGRRRGVGELRDVDLSFE